MSSGCNARVKHSLTSFSHRLQLQVFFFALIVVARGAGGWVHERSTTSVSAPASLLLLYLSLSASEHGSTYLGRSRIGDLTGALVLRVIVASVCLGKNNRNERLSTNG